MGSEKIPHWMEATQRAIVFFSCLASLLNLDASSHVERLAGPMPGMENLRERESAALRLGRLILIQLYFR